MDIKIRDILLKSIPYLLSIAGGVALFIFTIDDVHDPSIVDLMNNISASLLSIPIVFLLYDYSNYRISKKLNQTLASTMSSRAISVMLEIIILLRHSLNIHGKLTLGSINKMQDMRTSDIAKKIKITPTQTQSLRTYHAILDDMVYKYGKNNILDSESMDNLSGLTLSVLHLINENVFRKDKKMIAKYVVNIIEKISDWLDSDAGAAINFEKILQQATDSDNPMPAVAVTKNK